jgi:superfamily II DNA or RNA helicase
MKSFRDYQEKANQAISEELLINNKCLVKMFCGTGKSLLMRNCDSVKDKKLLVYVFPSLSLIDQFVSDYLFDFDNKINISSEKESTTDPRKIIKFLKNENNKIICVTYQSFNILIDCLNSLKIKINICCFDEAHHIVGDEYQKLIFQNDKCEKQIFFTATPKNANGIVMYDSNNLDLNMCGKLVYDYSYMKGLNEGYLNPFEIRLDLYTENSNQSIYECIARAILASGNTRVLTFHSDVSEESESETSVLNFVKEDLFIHAFQKIQREEFPRNKIKFKKIVALHSNISAKDRKKILKEFDNCSKNNIYIISSCETIGEGIDTKNANMCVFVDPKSSYIKIIQNIGRIVRKSDNPLSTILIPCWIDKSKYIECEGDKEKCDEIIRQDMNKQGNFNGILKVICALKQEDEDIYQICLHYPDKFSPMEIENNLKQQGYTISSSNNDLMETLEGVLGKELDFEEYEYEDDEDLIRQIAEDNDVCVEIHTDSLETPIITCNEGDKPMIILLRTEEDEEIKYQQIISTSPNNTSIKPPSRENRLKLKVNTNPDIKVFWGITSDIDLTKAFCSCVIDCEVVDMWEENFEKLKLFIDENKRRPNCHSNTIEERRLGEWLGQKVQHYKNKYMKAERHHKWTEFLEKYKLYFKDLDEIWNDNFEKLNKFIENIIEKEPKKIVNRIHINEPKLRNWWTVHYKSYKSKTYGMNNTERHDKFKKFIDKYQDYLKTDQDTWNEKFEKLKLFIDENKRRPNKRSDDTKEKELGQWMSSQITYYNKEILGMKKDSERYNKWKKMINDEKYKIYFNKFNKVLDEIWNDNFEKLKKFIDKPENKRRPSNTSTDIIEKKLGQWLSDQQHKYKNKTQRMKDETNYNQWTEFLEEYKEYFEKDKPTKKKSMKLATTNPFSEEEKIIVNETTLTQRKPCPKSQLSLLHREYKTLRSDNLNHTFKENSQLWEDYHRIAEENEKSFPEEGIPRNRIIEELKQIKTKRTKKVVDMGCGKGFISKYFKDDKRFEFTNLDHISSDETIISCDISKSDFQDDEVEICILSLALWGSNCREYITEAYRILESGGKLYIIEPTKRWSKKEEGEFGKVIQGTEAFDLKKLIEDNTFKIIKEEIDKFCLFVCIKC